MEKNYLPNLTPIRGVAALLVVIYHINLVLHGALAENFTHSIFSHLYMMVDLFFMISGFVMAHTYGAWFEKDVSLKQFIRFSIARFARIYPLYFFTLISLIVMVIFYRQNIGEIPLIFKETFNFHSIPVNALLIQSVSTFSFLPWNPPSWSISVEWWAYMIFPFIILYYFKFKIPYRNVFCLILCGFGYLILSLVLYNLNPDVISGIWPKNFKSIDVTEAANYEAGLLRCLFGFVIGIISYQYFKTNTLKNILANDYVIPLMTLLLGFSFNFSIPDYLSVWIFPCIILSAAYGSKKINRWLNLDWLKKLGDWSYSIYLTHMPILYGFILFVLFVPDNQYTLPSNDQPLLAWIIAYSFVSFTLLISFLTYKFIELPARSAIKKISGI